MRLWPRGCAPSDQPVANTVDVGDPSFAVVVELAAEAAGVAVERAGGAGRGVSPQVGQELLLVEDAPRVAGEIGEQVVLQASQVYGPAVDRDLARGGVDRQRADAQQRVVCEAGRGPAEDGAEARAKLEVGRWPGENVVGAGLERSQQIGLVGAGAEHHYRDVRLPVEGVIALPSPDVP